MGAYLISLEMTAELTGFRAVDVPRIAQLINRSNQFNVTTRRRTEAAVEALLESPAHVCFATRLADRFGDYGLISIFVGEVKGEELEVDTWLMSCRVLKRQVEEEVLNEVVRLANRKGCRTVRGVYLPTAKNKMVRNLFETLGFAVVLDEAERREFVLDVASQTPRPTHIAIARRSYDS
jgi:FkbH-like protein